MSVPPTPGSRQPAGDRRRPSVLDPGETWHLPANPYLACRPDGNGGLMLETREHNGQHVVPAYSSLEQFLTGCGADQPWIVIPAQRLADFAWQAEDTADPTLGAGGHFRFSVLLDVPLPSELRGTAGSMATDEPNWSDSDSEDWPVVYLASQPFRPGDAQARLELQPMPGERLAVMAYTSRTAIEAGCGPDQASFPVPAGLLSEARRQSGAHTICLDTPLPEYLRHGPGERNH